MTLTASTIAIRCLQFITTCLWVGFGTYLLVQYAMPTMSDCVQLWDFILVVVIVAGYGFLTGLVGWCTCSKDNAIVWRLYQYHNKLIGLAALGLFCWSCAIFHNSTCKSNSDMWTYFSVYFWFMIALFGLCFLSMCCMCCLFCADKDKAQEIMAKIEAKMDDDITQVV